VVKEILNNCIAHSNYQLRGKINLEEFEDRLVFINEGNFIPETIERALEDGYKPPYYRNTFLCKAMVNLYMIDTNSMGIPMMYQIQRDKCFPLPTYDLDNPNRVKVTLYGKVLDKNYTQLLKANGDLDLQTVFLLDKVQKHDVISKEGYAVLKKKGLVEGRYPNIFVSYKIANMVGQKTDYIKNKGLTNDVYKQLIFNALNTMGEASVSELKSVMKGALPAMLDERQQSRKVSNILQAMKKDGDADVKGSGHTARWYLDK
jgi:ATP-dependent DNA helicase RecG